MTSTMITGSNHTIDSTKYQYRDYVKGLSFLPNDSPFIFAINTHFKAKNKPYLQHYILS